MAKKKTNPNAEFAFFNVTYEDGSLSSNRRVPNADLAGLEGDAPAKAIIEAQDRQIGEMSGCPRGRIKSLARVGR